MQQPQPLKMNGSSSSSSSLRRPKNEWRSALLPTYHNCHACVYATVCPCVWTYHTASMVLRDHAAVTAMDDSGCSSCYASALSVMICMPSVFCVDRAVTKVLNGYADEHHHQPPPRDEEEGSFAEGVYNFVAGACFGTTTTRTNETWLNDGAGYDLLRRDDTAASEDYWAADWCGYYTYHAFCCNFLRGRTCNQSGTSTPMCFALMCGAIYPILLCPTTLLLRRIVVSGRNIHETCIESTLNSLLCTPCTMVQTFAEIDASDASKAVNTMT